MVQSTFDKRRAELKASALERGRVADELARMVLEDARSRLLQEIDRADRMRLQFEKEFGIVEESEVVGAVDELNTRGGAETGLMQFETVKVPQWMEVPAGWENWTLAQQKSFVRRAKAVRVLRRRIQRNISIDRKRMERYEARSRGDWEEGQLRAELRALESELEAMEAEETLQVYTGL